MHHTLIITANVRGSLATGRHGLSRRTHNKSTQKNTPTPRPQGDPAEHASAYLCVLVLKGERVCVCGCERLHVTQQFFLISQIGPGLCLRRRRQREGWCSALLCAVVCLCPSHTDAHTHTHWLCFLKDWMLLFMWPLMSFNNLLFNLMSTQTSRHKRTY